MFKATTTSPRLLIVGLIAIAATLTVTASLAAERATIKVNTSEIIGPVNPFIFGNNQLAYQGSEEYAARGAGIWDPQGHRPVAEFVDLAKQAGLSVARWPGGCGSHTYNWKLTVGPHDQRPGQPFGLPEFLQWCEATGARPILTVAEYWGEAQDGADLVEYLNAPNDGKHKWAAMRAADGHPAPYNVIWFEYGNESDHGDHGQPTPRIFTPVEYGHRYLAYQKAMKAVDPHIKLGAVIEHGNANWDGGVLRTCGKQMDFGIPHTYIPGYNSEDDRIQARPLMQAAVSCDEEIQAMYDWLDDLAANCCGRRNIPWAVTEFNGWFVQEKPFPYRQALGNALRNAENLRIMLRPKNHIMCATFWQYANEYWGMVTGHVDKGQPIVKQANYYVFQLYHEHFGDKLVAADVQCGRFEFDGAAGVPSRKGKQQAYKLFPADLLKDKHWQTSETPGVKQTVDRDTLTAEFQGQDINYYTPTLTMPAEPNCGYRLTGWIKTEELKSSTGASFQVGDGRGWTETHSCALGGNITGTAPWTKVTVEYLTLKDTTSLSIQARRLENGGKVTGKALYRVEKVQKFNPASAGAVPYVSCNAAVRKNGTVTLMLVNKDFDEDISTTVSLPRALTGRAKAAAWSLTGSSPTATNTGPEPQVGLVTVPADIIDGRVHLVLPKCSVTAVEISPGAVASRGG